MTPAYSLAELFKLRKRTSDNAGGGGEGKGGRGEGERKGVWILGSYDLSDDKR